MCILKKIDYTKCKYGMNCIECRMNGVSLFDIVIYRVIQDMKYKTKQNDSRYSPFQIVDHFNVPRFIYIAMRYPDM